MTKGPASVDPAEVRRLAASLGPVPVVMSDTAWVDYRVSGYPFLVLVDPAARRVVGETVAFGMDDVLALLGAGGIGRSSEAPSPETDSSRRSAAELVARSAGALRWGTAADLMLVLGSTQRARSNHDRSGSPPPSEHVGVELARTCRTRARTGATRRVWQESCRPRAPLLSPPASATRRRRGVRVTTAAAVALGLAVAGGVAGAASSSGSPGTSSLERDGVDRPVRWHGDLRIAPGRGRHGQVGR